MQTILLSILIALCAALDIFSKYRHSRRMEYIFKPLTTSLIIVLALVADRPVSETYHWLIVAGLVASLGGDVFLMLESDRFIQGLICFLIAHLLYIAAFTSASSENVSFWYIIPFGVYGILLLVGLWSHLGNMRVPVIVYSSVILIMAFQAANRWLTDENTSSLLALVGAYLFVASDSVLAVERFRGRFRSAPFWVLTTYFAAQWLIALSIMR